MPGSFQRVDKPQFCVKQNWGLSTRWGAANSRPYGGSFAPIVANRFHAAPPPWILKL